MNFFNELKMYWRELLIIILELIIIIIILIGKSPKKELDTETLEQVTEVTIEKQPNEYLVDIKGAVNNPGVYKLPQDAIINDVIIAAGGLKKNANTSNINLSKKIESEMVIKIFTTAEINKLKEVNTNTCTSKTEIITDCKDSSVIISDNSNNNSTKPSKEENQEVNNEVVKEETSLININNASKEELMTLNGIGDSKAEAIIEYRTKTPFKSIEDIKNVSGIGEQAFEKIKDYITV